MPMKIRFVYASTAGHTEYVLTGLAERLAQGSVPVTVTMVRAERATTTDLLADDLLLLACGTWNTGGAEGQLNPHMHALLRERAADLDLQGKPCLVIGLGDQRYRYTANAAVLLEQYITSHGGALIVPALKIVNEPYDRLDDLLKAWLDQLQGALRTMTIA